MRTGIDRRAMAAGLAATICCVVSAAPARADVFNGRIAFTSQRDGDRELYSMTSRGGDLRQLTFNTTVDAQPDWSPDGRSLAFRMQITTPRTLFQVGRMTAGGDGLTRLTQPVPTGREQSSQPAWFPDGTGFLFRRSGTRVTPSVWRMGPWGENPLQVFTAAGRQWYPSWAPDMSRIAVALTRDEPADDDRAIATFSPAGAGPTILFDDPRVWDSAPAWSPDGDRIAFESDTNVLGTNPQHDREIFVMDADGSNVRQLTRNAIRDEGPAWSPDATMLAYTSGPDDEHGDINVMTAEGVHLRTLAAWEGLDESPDWQAIPAPPTDRRCGDVEGEARDAVDVRAVGEGLACEKARTLAEAWTDEDRQGRRVRGFDASTESFGGTLRVILTHRGNHEESDRGNDKLVAFLVEPR